MRSSSNSVLFPCLFLYCLSKELGWSCLLACAEGCLRFPCVLVRLHLWYRNKWRGCFHLSLFSPYIAQFPSCFYLRCLKAVSLSWLLEKQIFWSSFEANMAAKLTSSVVSRLSSFLWPWYFSEHCETFRIHWTSLVLYHLSTRRGT